MGNTRVQRSTLWRYINQTLAIWLKRKYKRFHHRLGRARLFLEKIAREGLPRRVTLGVTSDQIMLSAIWRSSPFLSSISLSNSSGEIAPVNIASAGRGHSP